MPESDVALLEQIAKAEQQIFAACDLIPTTYWGFDEETQERLRQRKHKLVDEQLSKKEKKRLNNAQKGSMARSLGVSGTISEVFQWLSVSNVRTNVQVKAPVVKLEKPAKVNGETKKVHQPQKSVNKGENKQKPSSEDESDEEDEAPKTPSPVEKAKPAGKPVATVKPTVRVEKEVEPDEDDDDSTDEESAPLEKKGGQKRKNPDEMPTSAKKTKLDKELEKFENVDPSSLDPIESRHMAMLKLQKRLETMKQSRTGKKQEGAVAKKAAEALAEKKLKRRMSKLQMKQRRAEEKKKANGEDSTPKVVKNENKEPIVNDEGKVVYSKFDFIVKDPKKKRLSTSEKKEKFTGKDYRSLLHKAEKRNEKLAELKEADPEKAKEMEEDIKWNRALKKAEGVKVKDNVELLKKGLRKKEKAKEKRLAKWDQRVEKVSADKTKKQDKRTTNIAKRADDKKKKKMAKLRKKGRIL